MADSFVRVPADSTGKRVDASSLDVGADTVYRQRIVLADNSATAQYATVTGGALMVTGTVNVSAMPTVTVTGGVAVSGTAQVAISTPFTLNNISATVTVAGIVNLSATASVILAAGTANIGNLNHISRTVQVAVGTPFTLNNISATVVVAGVVGLTAGTAVIGDLNAISRTVQVAIGTPFTVNNISAAVVLAAGAANIGSINNISATVVTGLSYVVEKTTNSQVQVGDSANAAIRVNVVAGSSGGVSQIDGTTFSTQAANFIPIGGIFDDAATDTLSENDAGVVRMTTNRAFHVNLRDASGNELGAASATGLFVRTTTVALATGTVVNNISATVQVAIGTPFTINNISATTVVGMSYVVEATTGSQVQVGDSANAAIRVNVVACSAPSVTHVSLDAGTANIGHINHISATVTVAGVVGLTAGTANIGSINNISATVTVAGNVNISATATVQVIGYTPAIMSASHGPKCVTASTSANVTLIASPGAGANVYVTQLMVGNMSSTLTRARIGTSASISTVVQPCAASGGGFVLNFDPPWMLSASEACVCSVKPNVSEVYFTVNFFVR